MFAASTHRVRSGLRRRRYPKRRRRYVRKLKKFGRKVKRALKWVRKRRAPGYVGKNPPKWHIYRSTSLLNAGTKFTATAQASLDVAHGFQGHYDGLVALAQVAQMNIKNLGGGPPVAYSLGKPNTYVKVYKSYMILYMTNNSNTPVYGKMAVFKPRKNINVVEQTPGQLAGFDISGADQSTFAGPSVQNEYVNEQALANLGFAQTYDGYGPTDDVRTTTLTDMGWTWQNSPSFQRYWKGKMKKVDWGPMECKKFVFKFKRSFTIDCTSEYTLQPSTTTVPGTGVWETTPDIYLTPSDSGFAYMHKSRGFFVSFLMHGIPARDATSTNVGLTQPNMDMYWLNAYKYGWTTPNKKEFHVNPNPLAAIAPQIVQMFSPVAGPVVVG